MATVTLRKCRIRGDRFVPVKGSEPEELTIAEVLSRFVTIPNVPGISRMQAYQRRQQLDKLKNVQTGAFVGIIRGRRGGTTNFYLLNTDRSNNVKWILKHDPMIYERFVEIHRVEQVQWDSGIHEFKAPKRRSS